MFLTNDPVTHRSRKYGVVHSYFTRYAQGNYGRVVISDGNDCYEEVNASILYPGHIENPSYFGPEADAIAGEEPPCKSE
jgi:hypothetical protein